MIGEEYVGANRPNVLIYSKSMGESRANFFGFDRVDSLLKSLYEYAGVGLMNVPTIKDLDVGNTDICIVDCFDPNNKLKIGPYIDFITKLKWERPKTQIVIASPFNDLIPDLYVQAGVKLILKSNSLCPIADAFIKGYKPGSNYLPFEQNVGGIGGNIQAPINRGKVYGEGIDRKFNKITKGHEIGIGGTPSEEDFNSNTIFQDINVNISNHIACKDIDNLITLISTYNQ